MEEWGGIGDGRYSVAIACHDGIVARTFYGRMWYGIGMHAQPSKATRCKEVATRCKAVGPNVIDVDDVPVRRDSWLCVRL